MTRLVNKLLICLSVRDSLNYFDDVLNSPWDTAEQIMRSEHLANDIGLSSGFCL